MGKLTGRVAIVTGAATGLGHGIALLYAREGADVAVLDRNGPGAGAVAEAIAGMGRRSLAIAVDVGDEAGMSAAIAQAVAALGPPDILVNNAGIATVSLLETMPTSQWDEMIRINLTSVFFGCRAVMPHMRARRYGRIINISSQLAHKGGEGMAHYAAAKAGVLGLTRSLAYEGTADNIVVNAICPGPLLTDMRLPPEWSAKKTGELPVGRQGTVDEVAPTALLLACEDAAYYFGATFNPSGGDIMI
ncbi:SDR family NAD(P)-dependent oxidoreductase [Paracoccaceae bacterium Fryx2]|nr:SDR family NAD(P)-dependent oxidoreductase [Paracoccaceae bacterium Fryx2]